MRILIMIPPPCFGHSALHRRPLNMLHVTGVLPELSVNKTFTTQSAFRLLTCKQSANKPGGTYRFERRSSRLLQSNNFWPPGVTFLLTTGLGEELCGPCPSPTVDLQQQIDAGAIRVFTATSGIRGIDSGEHGMTTGRPKNSLNSAAFPLLQSRFPPG
ncbi:hypothetical protein CDAR_208671 [Caerostris darwini]|uniref:Uncharacterized protein n=1 Tax=Caerostris darwini TaxID=1538125 RepID=A0AAV4VT33_9ARAC|nr:hypothetical protein CDAR_208671 [Caerostris darwini]